MKRHKTTYPGVFYREAARIGGPGLERVYYIVFKKDGKTHEEKVGRQFADAMTPARAARRRGQRIEGRRPSRQELREAARAVKWTIDRLWQEYYQGWRTDDTRYKKHLQPALGHKEPKEIIALDLERLRRNLEKTLAPQTIRHVLVLLQRIVNYGVKQGLCAGLGFKIPMVKVNNLKTEDLTPEQLADLLAALEAEPDRQAADFMRLALVTGLRAGELLKLKWEDVDFHRGFIHLRHPKGGQDQTIPLNEAARQILAGRPRPAGSAYVFPGPGGGRRSAPPARIRQLRDLAGLPKDFRPLHGLRHAYASMLASSGQVDLYTLQKLLTHKSPDMTMRYAHLRDEALRRAADLAGQLIGQAGKDKTRAIEGGKKK
jgi:integrase